MFRKAALALALVASVLGAEAMPARELTNRNKTKSTKPNNGIKSKAKTVGLCLFGLDGGVSVTAGANNNAEATAALAVFDCADVGTTGAPKNGEVEPIGIMGISCVYPAGTPILAPCATQLTLDTAWHKTNKKSSLVASFWFDPLVVSDLATLGKVTMEEPVVTGANGAWGKTDSVKTLSLEPFAGSNNQNYKLTIGYKTRGWNPAAY